NVRKPANSLPAPQRGQRPARPRLIDSCRKRSWSGMALASHSRIAPNISTFVRELGGLPVPVRTRVYPNSALTVAEVGHIRLRLGEAPLADLSPAGRGEADGTRRDRREPSRSRRDPLVAAGSRGRGLGPGAQDIDAGKQEQPNHVDEVPVPGAELEAEMLLGREVSELGADQADDQERRADDHMRAVEAGRHEEGGAV